MCRLVQHKVLTSGAGSVTRRISYAQDQLRAGSVTAQSAFGAPRKPPPQPLIFCSTCCRLNVGYLDQTSARMPPITAVAPEVLELELMSAWPMLIAPVVGFPE